VCAGRSQNIDDSIKTLIETPCDHLAEVVRARFELAKHIRGGIKTYDELVAVAKILFAHIGKPLAAIFNIKIPLITAFDKEPKLEYNDFIIRKSSSQTTITNEVTAVASIITCSIMTLSNSFSIRCVDLSGIGVLIPNMKTSLKIDQNVFQSTGWVSIETSFADFIIDLRYKDEFIQQKDTLRYKPATAAAALNEPGVSNTFIQERIDKYGKIPAPRFAQPPRIAHSPPQKEESSCTLM
jgi:hypothetical protein